ncbi:MAG: substrate-binding domain-containing protein, partial [Clostridia bacterium]|nr:substrate-binding domain-containing protein [Clostridia bacterium]
DGSGTRGAFVELFGIEEEVKGEKIDKTYERAEVTNSTSVMMTTIEGNKNAVGYVSLGVLNPKVKTLKIDGVEPSAENIENGSYTVARSFNIVTKEKTNEVVDDFIGFIMSKEGQKVVEDEKYISVKIAEYKSKKPKGRVTIAGSSSVAPVMEVLKEAYLKVNTNAKVDLQQNDSTTGINSVIEGICDIGMASRELKKEEMSKGIVSKAIAKDGLAVVVNFANKVDDLTSTQVKQIFTGKVTSWGNIIK